MLKYTEKLVEQYAEYTILDEYNEIIGFKEKTPESAKIALKEHLLIMRKFDDVTNYDYYDELIAKLGI